MEAQTGLAGSEQFDDVQWRWMKTKCEQGALILVDRSLELATVEERLAADDTRTVQAWLASHLIARPTAEQITAWDQEPDRPFSMIVVRPFVLIQEMSPEPHHTMQ